MSNQDNTIKNHISAKVPTISNALSNYFGFNLSDVANACKGDMSQMQRLGELGRQGKLLQKFSPLVAQAAIEAMKGTSAYNKALTDVAVTGSREGLSIDKNISKVIQSEARYQHEILEIATDLAGKKEQETLRHNYQMSYIQTGIEIDKHMTGLDMQTQMSELVNRPDLKQLEIHEQQQLTMGEHLLEYGDLSRIDLLAPIQKSYPMSKDKKKGLLQSFLSIFSGSK